MKVLLTFAYLTLATVTPAQASLMRSQDPASLGVSCETVRLAAKSFTREHLEEIAKTYGVTPQQRREAMGCLRRQPSREK